MNNRIRKRMIYRQAKTYRESRHWMSDEEYAWEYMHPVGREFGSPDYERLAEIDNMAFGADVEFLAETSLYIARVEGLDGALAHGESRDEAIDNLRAVLEMQSDDRRNARRGTKRGERAKSKRQRSAMPTGGAVPL